MSHEGIRVVLVEDHVLLAESLHVALSAAGFDAASFSVPADTADAVALLDPILTLGPDVVLLDLDLGTAIGDGTTLVAPLSRAGCAVVVVTSTTEPTRWGQCLASGARTVQSKSSSLDEIVDTVERVAAGQTVIGEGQRYALIQHWYRSRAENDGLNARLTQLSPREEEVLAALTAGKRVRDIAAESHVSEATVRTQVKSVLAKLGVTSQLAAVALVRDRDRHPTGQKV